jgi:CubicO group peptidase (beta-lactamase class C family)
MVPVVLLAVYAFVHGAPPPPATSDAMPPPGHMAAVTDAPRTIDELRARIAEVLERDQLPGAAIAVVGPDGPIWVGGIGVRDVETRAPMDADTVFRVGSLSKSVVALGVMRLVDQGKLDLDRPLREILPDVEIDNPWEAVAPVTLAQCMEHTAGLDEVRFNEVFTDDEGLAVRDTLAINPRSRRIRWRPGTRHGYSNVGYTLAARAIEVATGEPFDAYLRREILAPIGIVDADFRRTSVIAPRLATGYMRLDKIARFFPFAHRPSGALLASASDLAKLVQFWLRRGEGYPPVVSRAGLARIEQSGTLPYPHLAGDYGFANYGDVQHAVLGRGHDGGMPGFHASFRYFPELGAGYAMLLNATYEFRGYWEIRALLFAYLAQGKTFAPPPVPVVAGERPGAGYFALANPRNEVFGFIDRAVIGWRVSELADGVRIEDNSGYAADLVPTADGGYRYRNECGSSVQFVTTADGTRVMLEGFAYAEAAPWWLSRIRYLGLGLTMLLLELAPLIAVCVLGLSAIQRRRILPLSLVVWPAIAGLCSHAFLRILNAAFLDGVIGSVNPWTVGFCATTILFAVASTATLLETIRWSVRPDRPPLELRLFPTACALAFFALTLWLAANGWIGLRTWAW